MDDVDKSTAENLILQRMKPSTTHRSQHHRNNSSTNTNLSQQVNDPLDVFLDKCGIATASSVTTVNTPRRRSFKEQLAFYVDRVQEYRVFEDFWNTYQHVLPEMTSLVRSYNIRPASSVASESLFSIAGYVQRKHRSSLASDTLRYSMILRDRDVLVNLI